MFDVGFSELLVIAAVALVVLGPEQLPGLMLKLGRWAGMAKRQMARWQAELEDAALDAEIREHNERITKEQHHPRENDDPAKILDARLREHDVDQ